MFKILIIEDNREIRENLEELLELSKFEVISAVNGKIGIEKAIQNTPHLILSDIAMPITNGYEVYESLRPFLLEHNIKFVFLTSSAQEKEITMGKNLGANAYLTKPFYTEELVETIELLLKKS